VEKARRDLANSLFGKLEKAAIFPTVPPAYILVVIYFMVDTHAKLRIPC